MLDVSGFMVVGYKQQCNITKNHLLEATSTPSPRRIRGVQYCVCIFSEISNRGLMIEVTKIKVLSSNLKNPFLGGGGGAFMSSQKSINLCPMNGNSSINIT